jgi:hypothetical protein
MTPAQAQAWVNTYGPTYAPLPGFAWFEVRDAPFAGTPGGFSVSGRESKHALGRASRADYILAQSVLTSIDAISAPR